MHRPDPIAKVLPIRFPVELDNQEYSVVVTHYQPEKAPANHPQPDAGSEAEVEWHLENSAGDEVKVPIDVDAEEAINEKAIIEAGEAVADHSEGMEESRADALRERHYEDSEFSM